MGNGFLNSEQARAEEAERSDYVAQLEEENQRLHEALATLQQVCIHQSIKIFELEVKKNAS